MPDIIKRLTLGFFLILAASAILLLSDLNQRQSTFRQIPRIAVLQYSSRELLDDTVNGLIQGLRNAGFNENRNIQIRKFNAENDLPTTNAIAKEISGGRFDMVLTVSTPCLQAMANANIHGKAIHVFCAVTDPFGAGVGLNKADPKDHPRHLVGLGTFQPVESVIRMAKGMNPDLKTIGTVWNPGEACSQSCLEIARIITKELGIDLVEVTVDNSSGVQEASASLLMKGVEAIWIGGDNTVEMSIDMVVDVAKKAHLPIFTNNPDHAKKGALFALGANYFEVGTVAGTLAGEILKGQDPSTIPIGTAAPEKLYINKAVLKSLKGKWQFPQNMLGSAAGIVNENGFHEPSVMSKSEGQRLHKNEISSRISNKPIQKNLVHILQYMDSPAGEQSLEGVLLGLREGGFIENKNVKIHIRSAQGDMTSLNTLMDAALTDRADLVITLSTPTLQAAIQKLKTMPVVFTHIANPFAAGAGTSDKNHLPNITGAYNLCDYEGLIRIAHECIPSAKQVGTLFTPSETNSVFHKKQLEKAGKKLGIQVIAVGASTGTEVADAAMSLCSKNTAAICQIADNLCDASFVSIAKAASIYKIPLFGFVSHNLEKGAVLVLARDFKDTGREAGLIAARVLRGEDPANIPIYTIETSKLMINAKAADALSIMIPKKILNKADSIIE